MAVIKEQWWYVDKEGRQIGWMWPEEFETMLESFYGYRKWINAFGHEYAIHRSTIDRWRHGKKPIPKHIAQIVYDLMELKKCEVKRKPLAAPWLPDAEGTNATNPDPEPDTSQVF